MAGQRGASGSLATIAIRGVTALMVLGAMGLFVAMIFTVGWVGGAFLNQAAPDEAHIYALLAIIADAALWACAIGLALREPWAWAAALVVSVLGIAGSIWATQFPPGFWLPAFVASVVSVVALIGARRLGPREETWR